MLNPYMVTDAASGMGCATARTLIAAGATAAIGDSNAALFQKAAHELDPNSKVVCARCASSYKTT